MRLADPILLLLLLLIPVVLWLNMRRHSGSVRFSSLDGFERLAGGRRLVLRHIPMGLRLLAVCCWVLALARPQVGRTTREIHSEGVDIMLVLDTSGSMAARDLEWTTTQRHRLEVAKEIMADFIGRRPADRIGLVVFGEHAFTQCPLTLDHGVLWSFLDEIEIGHAGARATAIGDALGVAVKRLKDIESASKIVILMTDGRNNSGEIAPLTAAEIAKTFGVTVYTIGVGTHGKAPFVEQTIFGRRVRYEQEDIDEQTLTDMAAITGGRYFRATDAKGLERIYAIIDELEKVEVTVHERMEYSERFVFFVLLGMVLLFVEMLLAGTWLRSLP